MKKFSNKKMSLAVCLIALIAICITCLIPAVSSFGSSAKAADVGKRYLGDVDGDGRVTAADARLALRAAIGLEDYAPGTLWFVCADYDGNGEITAGDARMVLRTAVALEILKLLPDTTSAEGNDAVLKAEEEAKQRDLENENQQKDPEPAPPTEEPSYQGDGINTCMYCSKPCAGDAYGNNACAFGGCTRSSFFEFTCIHCGVLVPANICHTCENPVYIITTEPEK